MRKHILFILAMLPCMCFGQQFEIGVDGGFNFHSLPMNNYIAKQDKARAGYVGGASIDLLLPKTQIGIGVTIASLTEINYLAPNYTIKVRDYVANPLANPYAYYNHVWDQGKSYTYAGAMGGLAVAKVGVNTFNYSGTSATGYSTAYNTAIGYALGLQAGFIIRASKHIGIGGQAAMRFTAFTYTPPNISGDNPYKYKLFYFPFTVNLKYAI